MALRRLTLAVLFLGCCLSAAQASGEPQDAPASPAPAVVYLDKGDRGPDGVRNLARLGLLNGELVRQAFLIAAREELGLVTRDARLGDAMPSDGDNPPFAITAVKVDDLREQELWRGFTGKRTSLEKYTVDTRFGKDRYLAACVRMEEVSRSQFVDFLRKAGFSGESIPVTDAGVPEAIEKLLSEMTFLAQFSAVRQLHALAHESGTSDTRLGALVRGYANLGCLTEFYWHPAHKVFKARAMLYARRLLAQNETSPWGQWHWGYALAMVGLPKHARAALDAANKSWESLPKEQRPPRPKWVDLVDAHCRYDDEAIVPTEVDARYRQLATLLVYLTIERCGYKPAIEKAGVAALEAMPECYRICDPLGRYGDFDVQDTATLAGLATFGERAYPRLLAIPGFPPQVKRAIQGGSKDRLFDFFRSLSGREESEIDADVESEAAMEKESRSRQAVIVALLNVKTESGNRAATTNDLGEPSWATLGLLIRELSFTQVEIRARAHVDPMVHLAGRIHRLDGAAGRHASLPCLHRTNGLEQDPSRRRPQAIDDIADRRSGDAFRRTVSRDVSPRQEVGELGLASDERAYRQRGVLFHQRCRHAFDAFGVRRKAALDNRPRVALGAGITRGHQMGRGARPRRRMGEERNALSRAPADVGRSLQSTETSRRRIEMLQGRLRRLSDPGRSPDVGRHLHGRGQNRSVVGGDGRLPCSNRLRHQRRRRANGDRLRVDVTWRLRARVCPTPKTLRNPILSSVCFARPRVTRAWRAGRKPKSMSAGVPRAITVLHCGGISSAAERAKAISTRPGNWPTIRSTIGPRRGTSMPASWPCSISSKAVLKSRSQATKRVSRPNSTLTTAFASSCSPTSCANRLARPNA